MSSGLMFDEIIMGKINRNVLSNHTTETDCVFTQIISHIIYIYTGGHFNIFYGKNELTSI